MDILTLLEQIGDLAAIFYAGVALIALGLFFWDRQPERHAPASRSKLHGSVLLHPRFRAPQRHVYAVKDR